MKSILHLKDDTEYQIPLRETEEDDRAKVGTTEAEKATNKEKVTATQLQNDPTVNKETDEISQEEVTDEKKVDDAEQPALETVKEDPDESKNREKANTEESNSGTTTESVPPADTAKAALDEMKKLASQEGVIHPSLFISNFSKILGLMERAMQLQVEESGSVTKEEAPKATEQAETTEKPEVPEGDK